MTVLNKLTGYDRHTECLDVEFTLSVRDFAAIKSFVELPPEYEETYGSLELQEDVARRILWHLDKLAVVETRLWYLEPFVCTEA